MAYINNKEKRGKTCVFEKCNVEIPIQILQRVVCYLDVEVEKFVKIMEETFKVVSERIEKSEGCIVFSVGSKDFERIGNEKIKIGGKQVKIYR